MVSLRITTILYIVHTRGLCHHINKMVMHSLSWLLEVSSKVTKYFLDTMNKTLWVSQTSELNLYTIYWNELKYPNHSTISGSANYIYRVYIKSGSCKSAV